MESIQNRAYDRYLVYPNESIDKLTVNRTFERLFEDIDARTSSSGLALNAATQKSYGKAKFSAAGGYSFEDTAESDYSGSMLRIGHLKDMTDRMVDGIYDAAYAAPLSSNGSGQMPLVNNRYWVRSKYMDSKFIFMPNGINIVTCSFELGFNGISKALGVPNVASEDVISPVPLTSYSNQIDVDSESVLNVNDYISDEHSTTHGNYATQAMNILNMDGRTMKIPFIDSVNTTLRHNRCGFGKRSTYRQSYVELCMSVGISLKSLYEAKYGLRSYSLVDEDSHVVSSAENSIGPADRQRFFTQSPMVMAQLGFYNNDSAPRPLFGYDDHLLPGTGTRVSEFSPHNRLSQKPVDSVPAEGGDISPLNGGVFVKNVENVYDRSGNIIDNVLRMDVVMKYMAGSAADPELEYAMDRLNSRSKVQFVMMGV